MRFLGIRTVSQGLCLVGMILCLCLPVSLLANDKVCPPFGDVPNGTCAEGATCATFDGRQPKCTGWSRDRCAAREYRNMKTCECLACPRDSGQNCMANNECCSLEECAWATTSTPKAKPYALSPASRLIPDAATLLLLWLPSMLLQFPTHQFYE